MCYLIEPVIYSNYDCSWGYVTFWWLGVRIVKHFLSWWLSKYCSFKVLKSKGKISGLYSSTPSAMCSMAMEKLTDPPTPIILLISFKPSVNRKILCIHSRILVPLFVINIISTTNCRKRDSNYWVTCLILELHKLLRTRHIIEVKTRNEFINQFHSTRTESKLSSNVAVLSQK